MASATLMHADLDAFYASVAELRDPSLTGRPFAVGGGVILSASYEARRYGVRSGMPLREARRLCPDLIVAGGDFESYSDISAKVFEVCRRFTPLVEQISIDEAFLDVAGAVRLFGPPAQIAREVRAEVRGETGLALSIGVARTKFLAKVGSQVAKPDGIVVVDPATELRFLHRLPVRYLWGVGPVTQSKLAEYGIATVGQLATVPRPALVSALGPATGRHLHALAWNVDPRGIVIKRRARSVGAQSAFGRDVHDRSEYRRVLAGLADRVGSRLRAKDRAGRTVTVRVRFSDFQSVSRARTLGAPISTTGAIYSLANELVDGVVAEYPDRGIGLFGISVSQLGPDRPLQLELPLCDPTGDALLRAGSAMTAERLELDKAVDELRARFGTGSVKVASRLHAKEMRLGEMLDAALGQPDREAPESDEERLPAREA